MDGGKKKLALLLIPAAGLGLVLLNRNKSSSSSSSGSSSSGSSGTDFSGTTGSSSKGSVTINPSPPSGTLSGYAQHLSSYQLEIVDLLEQVFCVEYGQSIEVAIAAVLNSIAESALGLNIYGDKSSDSRAYNGYCSIGLFQCNMCGGLGSGHSAQDLADPWYNARLMAANARGNGSFQNVVSTYPTEIDKLTWAFTNYLERPANADAEGDARAATYRYYFPSFNS